MLAITATSIAGATDKGQRAKWFEEMRRYKSEYIAERLKLDDKQKAEFTPVYEQMDIEIGRLNHEMRQLERNIRKNGESVTETEYEKAAEAQFEMRAKEASIERTYFPKFKKILTPQQLYELKMPNATSTATLWTSTVAYAATSTDRHFMAGLPPAAYHNPSQQTDLMGKP